MHISFVRSSRALHRRFERTRVVSSPTTAAQPPRLRSKKRKGSATPRRRRRHRACGSVRGRDDATLAVGPGGDPMSTTSEMSPRPPGDIPGPVATIPPLSFFFALGGGSPSSRRFASMARTARSSSRKYPTLCSFPLTPFMLGSYTLASHFLVCLSQFTPACSDCTGCCIALRRVKPFGKPCRRALSTVCSASSWVVKYPRLTCRLPT
mmetsp:Transcript_13903/g.58894  ORF Transcript_13903/g.58894 Transcript_13903/m.58894 type:complete len:208 (-) Transcript_13903:480-1103(-)